MQLNKGNKVPEGTKSPKEESMKKILKEMLYVLVVWAVILIVVYVAKKMMENPGVAKRVNRVLANCKVVCERFDKKVSKLVRGSK